MPQPGPTAPDPVGLVLEPFRGVRYAPALVGDVGPLLAPPNDVLSETAVESLHHQNTCNTSHLTRPDSYEVAAATWSDWRARGVLATDPAPGLYVYEQRPPGFATPVTGLIGALRLSPADAGVVLPHENTRPGPVEDRLLLAEATRADLEPIMLVYDGSDAVDEAMTTGLASGILLDTTTGDGVRHRLAALTDTAVLDDIASSLSSHRALIADGHHRHAMYIERQRLAHAAGRGDGPWDLGMALLLSSGHSGMQIRAIHRFFPELQWESAVEGATSVGTVTALDGDGPGQWLAALEAWQGRGAAYVLCRPGRAVLWTGFDEAAVARALPADHGEAWRSLDVSTFAHYALPRGLGVLDGDGVDEADAETAVRAAGNSGGVAVLLRRVGFEQVLAVAAAGDRMPRKSTLFVPKPASGVVFRALDT